LFISLVFHRFAKSIADAIEAFEQCKGAAHAFHDYAAHVLLRIQLWFLRQKSHFDARLRTRLAVDVLYRYRP
jgi:hypothetical protein